MAEDNEKMEMSTEGAGHFWKENLISDGAFSLESKYYLLLGNPILTILGDEFLILREAHRTVHSA
ncbi:hypothetical protein DVH24_004435 [Malus domestica]|uniref:Uncharacterized protein n=1 Tax=Malus domestica TaxID=3750 RepID=A0A498IG87_MALDO|nr:hypothetical protein DVH24_004435 [Malus domestica]